ASFLECQPIALGPLGPLAGLLRLIIIHNAHGTCSTWATWPKWTANLAAVPSRSKITTCSSTLACSGPTWLTLRTHTGEENRGKMCSPHSAMQFGRMALEGGSELVFSAQVWRARSGCATK